MGFFQLKSCLMARLKPKAQKGYVRRDMQQMPNCGSASKRPRLETEETSSTDNDPDSSEKTENGSEIPSDGTSQELTPLRGECKVLSVDDGTPIVTLYSPFANLPAQTKWATNTTDHIMYENLPESTGKYENIRGILQKVRDSKKLNFDDVQDGEWVLI